MTSPIVRFAPSPTGYLHVGNVRTALINYLFVKKEGGQFILRLDDTDLERSRPEYAEAIQQDLAWLGIMWDVLHKQSDRFDDYAKAAQKLKDMGRLYPCYETQEELDIKRKMMAGRGLPPIYDRASLKLTDEQKAQYDAQGRRPHWRFLLQDTEVKWDDLIRGETKFKATHMSDPVLLREDGVPVYTLASVVDDGEMKITHVVRGEDHVSNTAVQVQLYEALGYVMPQFAHMALLKTKEGELSKRLGGNDIRGLRDQGIMPMSINSLLAKMGTSDPIEAFVHMRELVDGFNFSKFGRSPANYDLKELFTLNEKLLRQLDFSHVSALLPDLDAAFWLAIRGNITSLEDAKQWWGIVHGEVSAALSAEELIFVADTAQYLPAEPWDEGTYAAWMEAVKPTTPRKGKELFLPLRKALTGMEHGPELKVLLPLLGRAKTLKRLKNNA